jgi:hypothetical protein
MSKGIPVFDLDVDATFGNADELPDWRKTAIENDTDPDDEDMEETPADVIAILGFDPKDMDDDEDGEDDESEDDL